MYSCGPPHMDVQEWDDQHELTYSSYVRTRDVTLKTCRRRWMIGRNGERRSGISAQAARHDDDDDDIYIYIVYVCSNHCSKRLSYRLQNVSSFVYRCSSLLFFSYVGIKMGEKVTHIYPSDGHLPPITKTIQVRRTRHAGHCWRSRDELIRDVLLWTPTHGRAKAGRPARTYIQQLCEDTGCCPEDLPEGDER